LFISFGLGRNVGDLNGRISVYEWCIEEGVYKNYRRRRDAMATKAPEQPKKEAPKPQIRKALLLISIPLGKLGILPLVVGGWCCFVVLLLILFLIVPAIKGYNI